MSNTKLIAIKKENKHIKKHTVKSNLPFYLVMGIVASTYIILILAMVLADVFYTTPKHIFKALASTEIQYAIKLSLISSTITMLLSVVVAIPIGYFMARFNFRFKKIIDAIIDIPIILPPLVVGLSLLLLFQTVLGQFIESHLRVTYTVYGVVLAQFMVACAFAVRTMYVTFSQINNRQEQVALTLGCNEKQSFFYILLPQAKSGILTAASLAWARALGEFGPILIFAGATRMRTEVLPTTVFLEMSVGNIEAAVAVSLIMIASGFLVLLVVRLYGTKKNTI
ncbi:ABC transporter permease [Cellulophaga fucicola]|uniref:Molybdate transport system permease protein n=2 Tax=Cellulophaga fucicola TaxID=76595 RepID=A0A1K1QHM5_9FLAO|nr:ABC transporter permease subunit [Cellulophaga fucicola]SFW59456.1 molybdate transport system permease protein [Cellulophaga fucicola]